MAFTPKTWVGRSVEHPGRINLTPTGTTNQYDTERAEGEVYNEGDLVSDVALNNLEDRIANAFDDIGLAYVVLGHYNTLSALQTAHPTGQPGDAYFVGTTIPYNVYQWDIPTSAWINVGQIQGPKGDSGLNGADGENGAAATITVGTVSTGAAGTSASITNVGTSAAAVFNFTIPRGDKGEQGVKGDTGAKGDDGTSFIVLGLYATLSALQAAHPTGNAGDAYSVGTAEDNTIYLWNTSTSQWVDIGKLQGPQGVKGDTGTAATISVGTVSTGAAGSSVSVTNSGTENEAVFNFTIPKGDKGDTGSTGETGQGVVAGGTTGQFLRKASNSDYATEWGTVTLDNIPNGTTRVLHNITISTSTPTGGSDGDIWLQVEV
ncbi:MAG: hypothetical protein E7L17_13155 [Clostridium sp.]|uniref:hypothetical protein n=1 Tax=Clostridium sp. TaxID=1506 RepID=UPI00290B3941|nr:hypothetical protein [Clostridium sp.]MDU7339050.1 hypothetical protein [Clostridium sp.]